MNKIKLLIMIICIIIVGACTVLVLVHKKQDSKAFIASNKGSIELTDFKGRKVIIANNPQRIVSLSGPITEILYDLGLQDKIIGIADEVNYPYSIMKNTRVGTCSNINIELIKSLKPDIIFASKYTYQNTIETLQGLSIPVAYIEADSYSRIFETIDLISKMFSIKQKGDELSKSIKQQVVDITNKVVDTKRPNVLYIQSVEPLYVAGSKTLINDIIWMSGGTNAASDIIGYGELNKSKFNDRTVDIIIIASNIGQKFSKDYFKSHNFYKDLDAVKNNNIFIASDEDLYVNVAPRVIKAINEVTGHIILWNKSVGEKNESKNTKSTWI